MKKLLLLLLLTSCAQKNVLKEINLTYVKTPLNVPAMVNVKRGFTTQAFADQKIAVKYLTAFNGSQQIAALASGEVDIVPTMGDTSAIVGLANKADIKIIGIFGRSPKAFMIVSKDPTIKTIADLKGKKIGGPKGSVLHQLLLAALQSQNLKIDDVDFISLGVQEGLTGVLSGDLDAALLVGPATMAAQKQGAQVITTGEGFVDGTTVMVARTEFLSKYPNVVKDFKKAHQQSVDFITSNPEETLQLVSEETSLSIPQIQKMLPNYDFSPMITQTDIDNLNKTQDFLFEQGLIENKIDLKQAIHIL